MHALIILDHRGIDGRLWQDLKRLATVHYDGKQVFLQVPAPVRTNLYQMILIMNGQRVPANTGYRPLPRYNVEIPGWRLSPFDVTGYAAAQPVDDILCPWCGKEPIKAIHEWTAETGYKVAFLCFRCNVGMRVIGNVPREEFADLIEYLRHAPHPPCKFERLSVPRFTTSTSNHFTRAERQKLGIGGISKPQLNLTDD